MVSALLLSKNYCHLILNNKKFLKLLYSKKFFLKLNKKNFSYNFYEKYYLMLKYCISYAWIILYKEEQIVKTNINIKNRFVFDIETANLLPYFPYISTTMFLS